MSSETCDESVWQRNTHGNHRFAGLVLHVSNEIRIGREI